uniref:HMG box domain-containing protein n=2 Tax=Leptocylindrus danicus TaxID=163516 RepID=A0A7S2K4A5_9STRA|mmetsp:Transcript_16152/g.23786  ORF Transcript_16152/g.23786 Transcript_16152/m.23786 type:complete len:333 (+) Transcript_16152:93-1091(+)
MSTSGAQSTTKKRKWEEKTSLNDEDHKYCYDSETRSRKGFKKCPNAPKRHRTAYIHFSMAKMAELKAQSRTTTASSGDDKATSMAKVVSECWKTMSLAERTKWNAIAERDKVRYNVEKSLYTGPWKVPKAEKRKAGNQSAPKKPMTAFLFFANEERPRIKRGNPEMKNMEVSKRLGEMWKSMSLNDRKPFETKYKEALSVYRDAIGKWRKEEASREDNQRKKREAIATAFAERGAYDIVHSNYQPFIGTQRPASIFPPANNSIRLDERASVFPFVGGSTILNQQQQPRMIATTQPSFNQQVGGHQPPAQLQGLAAALATTMDTDVSSLFRRS